MSLQEAARIYGSVLLSNAESLSVEFRETIEKVLDQIEAEEAELEAEIELNEALDLQESAQIAALAKADELIEAQEELQDLQDALLAGDLTEEELLALQAQLEEAEALVGLLEGEVGDLQLQLDEAIAALEAAQETFDEASAALAQSTQEADEAIDAYAESLDLPELANNTNLTGQNETEEEGDIDEFTITDSDEEVDLNEGDESDDVLDNFEDTEDPDLFGDDDEEFFDTDLNDEELFLDDGEDDGSSSGKTVDGSEQSAIVTPDFFVGSFASFYDSSNPSFEQFTIEAWVKISTATMGDKQIFSLSNISMNYLALSVTNSAPTTSPEYKIKFESAHNNGSTTTSGESDAIIPYNTWTHIAVAVKNGSATFLINGDQSNTITNAYDVEDVSVSDYGHSVRFGRDQSNNGPTVDYLDEFRFWQGNTDDLIGKIKTEAHREIQIEPSDFPSSDGTNLIAYSSFTEVGSPSGIEIKTNNSSTPTLTVAGQSTTETGPLLAEPGTDPIILDLGGDGIDLVGLEADVQFDTDNDGILENTGWYGSEEGLLVADINNDSIINDMSEIVSLHFNYQNKNEAGLPSSLDVLKLYDDNNDMKIDSEDAIFNVLQIWQDANQNGQTDPGELQSLSDHGIKTIFLDHNEIQQIDQGNRISYEGQFEFEDGSKHKWNEVWFDKGEETSSYSTTEHNNVDNTPSDIAV